MIRAIAAPSAALCGHATVLLISLPGIGRATPAIERFSTRYLDAVDEAAIAAERSAPLRKRRRLSRALVRWALADSGCVPAANASFTWPAAGRPSLLGGVYDFSISHSGDEMAVAISADGPVGVDIEITHPRDLERLLARICSAGESARLAGMRDRQTGLYRLWTSKEALLKATGEGLTVPMRNVDLAGVLVSGDDAVNCRRGGRDWSISTTVKARRAIALAHPTARLSDVATLSLDASDLGDL